MDWLQSLFWPEYVRPVVWITDWGGPLGWLIAMHLVFYFAGVRRGLYVGLLGVSALLLNSWLKSLFVAPRPYFLDAQVLVHEPTPGLGMPSGHAQGAVAVWLAVASLARNKQLWLAVAALFVVAIGLSRVILGVHSFAQVLVGWTLGLACFWLFGRYLSPVGHWLSNVRLVVGVLMGLLVLVAASLVTVIIARMRADFVVPELWQTNFARVSADAVPLSAEVLFAPTATVALLGAAAGFMLVAVIQRVWPVAVHSLRERWLCLLVGLVVTGAVWWLIQVSGWLRSPVALTLPLLYPVLCGYLPVAITQRLGQTAAATAQ